MVLTFMSQTKLQPEPTLLELLHGKLPYGVAVFDRDLRLIYANTAWLSFHAAIAPQHGPLEIGTGIAALFAETDWLLAAALESIRTGESRSLRGCSWITQAGEQFWDITLSPLTDAGQVTGLIAISDQATVRVTGERAAAAKARLAGFRAAVSQALASSDDIDTVLQSCAEAMVNHAPAAFARIWVLDEPEDVYRLRASAGLYTRLNGTYARIPVDWIRQKTFRVYEPNIEPDIRTHLVREPDWAAEQGLVAWANHPLIVHGQIIGFMAMFARQQFDNDTLTELAAVADAIAQFLERKRAETALREREQLFRNVFESAADGLVIYDLDSTTILEANPAFCTMHGYAGDACSGLPRRELVHPDAFPPFRDYLDKIKHGRADRVRLLHMRKDGTVFPAEVQGSAIVFQGRPAALSIVRDVTHEQEAQARLEQRVAERTQELSLLLDVSRNVASTLELQPLLGLILDAVRAAVEYQGAGILTLEDEVLVQVAQRGPALDDLSADLRVVVADADIIREALLGTEPLVIPDVWAESSPARAYRQAVTEEWLRARPYIRSWVGVPLRVRERTLGLLVITYGEANHFTDHHVRLLKAVAAQAAVAIANARLHEQARTIATLEERQRLARELHDAVTQTLFSASLIGDVLPTLWARNPERGEEALQDLRLLTRGALAEMRTLLFELRPAALTEAPLGELLQHLADAVTGRARLPVVVSISAGSSLPPEVRLALYRIAQEALNNVVKHAGAEHVDLQVSVLDDGTVELRIRDDGGGFDPDEPVAGHFGLQTMHERASAIGARLSVTSEFGAGTEVSVRWPADQPITSKER